MGVGIPQNVYIMVGSVIFSRHNTLKCGIPIVLEVIMPYKDKNKHNQRRRIKRVEDSLKRICDKCGKGGQSVCLLTLKDITTLKPAQLKKLEAACINCLLEIRSFNLE